MPVQFYVEQSSGSYQSGVADSEVYAGEIVANDGSGVALADAQVDDENLDGLALFSEEFMVGEDEDEVVDEVYAVDERVKYAPVEDSLRGHVRTPENNGTDPSPSIGHQDVVGLIDTSGTISSADEFTGRIVGEGYTDDSGTTYNTSNNNFVALGYAYRPGKQNNDTVSDFDTTVRVSFFGN